MPAKTCADCRRSRCVNGILRCEERRRSRSSVIGGVILLDVEQAKRAAAFERVCTLVAARCAFFQSVA